MKYHYQSVTIKPESYVVQNHDKINKILGVLDAKNLAKVLNVVGLTANPRKSKCNKITNAIMESLEKSPDLFRFKSKGLLISTMRCEERQRGRIELSFDDPQFEGVLDGGHNMLAIGCFILTEYFGDPSHNEIRRIKKWDDFLQVWKKYQDDLSEVLETFDFKIPIEIIYPERLYESDFKESVLEISDARNNNSSLTAQTKADHKGYFDILKQCLDPEIEKYVEWKDNDINKYIKSQDIVALAIIPFIKLQKSNLLSERAPKLNPISIYSSKGKCVENYNLIYEIYKNDDGNITDKLIISAFNMMKDIPKIYDFIYEKFGDAYNSQSPGFGRIGCVRQDDKMKKFKTKFYKRPCKYNYPDGFVTPIIASLFSLMKLTKNKDKIEWAVDNPIDFFEEKFADCIKLLVSNIKENDYNPQTVGKSVGAYEGMSMSLAFALT